MEMLLNSALIIATAVELFICLANAAIIQLVMARQQPPELAATAKEVSVPSMLQCAVSQVL